MKILADDKIPLVKELFGNFAEIVQKPGTLIRAEDLKGVDVLLVRTVTRVNQALLENSSVRFVGSATAGIDHLDCDYLEQARITWANAKGANAPAVAEYVLSCIAVLQEQQVLPTSFRLGIIGMGEVGKRVAALLKPIAAEILLNDPPRAWIDPDFHSTDLKEFASLDLISLHAPLTHTGAYPTYHLINAKFLATLNPQCVLLNAGRGAVIDEAALMNLNPLPKLCLDVWEHEPEINLKLMQSAVIATPHIAGYSLESKYRATLILYQHAQRLFNLPNPNIEPLFPSKTKLAWPCKNWQRELLQHYNPLNDSAEMKTHLLNSKEVGKNFEHLRRNYKLRNEILLNS